MYINGCFKRKAEAQVIFISPFTVCSSCKWKYVVCPFIYEETNASYPFANGLNGLNRPGGLVHLWQLHTVYACICSDADHCALCAKTT